MRRCGSSARLRIFRLAACGVWTMNRTTLTVAFTLVACVSAGRVVAQGTQTRPQAPATQPTANVPVSKMAVIYSAEFQDSKTGITRFNITLNKLNGEFQKIQDDLN